MTALPAPALLPGDDVGSSSACTAVRRSHLASAPEAVRLVVLVLLETLVWRSRPRSRWQWRPSCGQVRGHAVARRSRAGQRHPEEQPQADSVRRRTRAAETAAATASQLPSAEVRITFNICSCLAFCNLYVYCMILELYRIRYNNVLHYNSRSSGGALGHNPAPALRTIDTSGGGSASNKPAPQFQQIRSAAQSTVQNSNLRAVPMVQNPSCKVRVSNLPASVDFGRVSQMTTACGSVKTIQVDSGVAIIEFADPAGAEKFCATTNRKMMDLSILNVSRI